MLRKSAAAVGLVSQYIVTAAPLYVGTMTRASIIVFGGQPLAAVEYCHKPDTAVCRIAGDVPVQGEHGGHEVEAHVGDVVRGGQGRSGSAGKVAIGVWLFAYASGSPGEVRVVLLPEVGYTKLAGYGWPQILVATALKKNGVGKTSVDFSGLASVMMAAWAPVPTSPLGPSTRWMLPSLYPRNALGPVPWWAARFRLSA